MELRYNKGAVKVKRLRGRGNSSGNSAGRGTKGQKSRSGFKRKAGFEGGQMPIVRRLPKFGFTNIFKKKVAIVNVGDFEKFNLNETIDMKSLRERKVIKGNFDYLKILGRGDISKSYNITADFVSSGAKDKIEKAGGKVTLNS